MKVLGETSYILPLLSCKQSTTMETKKWQYFFDSFFFRNV